MEDEHKILLKKIKFAGHVILEIITNEERNILRSISIKETSLLKSTRETE